MSHPLDDAYAKLGRARTHLKKLNRIINKFVADHPYRIEPEPDPKTGELVLVAHSLVPDEPVPTSVSLVAGDVAHNLRGALNFLVWQLAIHRGKPHGQMQFPIIHDEGRAYPKPAPARFPDAVARYHLDKLNPLDLALIERLQPYNGGHLRHLALLALINDADKHKLLASAVRMAITSPPVLGGVPLGTIIEIDPRVALRDGAVLVRFRHLPFSKGKVEVDYEPPVFVLIGESGGWMASAPTFGRMARLTGLILRLFRDRF